MPDLYVTESSTPVAPLDAATVLEEAADLLLIRGVCRDGSYGKTPGGPRCSIGAIGCVLGHEYLEGGTVVEATRHTATKALIEHLRHEGVELLVTVWNDRTEDDFEVIDTLRHVAKDLRNQAVV